MRIDTQYLLENKHFFAVLFGGGIILLWLLIAEIIKWVARGRKLVPTPVAEPSLAWPQFSDDWKKKVATDEDECYISGRPSEVMRAPLPQAENSIPDILPEPNYKTQKRDAIGRFVSATGVSKDKARAKSNFAEYRAYSDARGPVTFKEWLVIRKQQWYKDLKAEDAHERGIN